MRKILAALALAALAPLAAAAAADATARMDALRAFDQANQVFLGASTSEEFLRAAGLYGEVLDAGFESGAVLFNLGNSYFRAGELGRAIAAYRRAERYLGRDPLLENNLATARLAAGQPAEETRSPWLRLVFWHSWWSYPQKVKGALALAAAAFLLGLLGVLSRARWPRRAALGALALFALLLPSIALDAWNIHAVEHGVVTAAQTTARKGESDSYAAAFSEPLRAGTEFAVLARGAGWLHVRLPNGLDGWIRGDDAVTY